MEGFCSGTCLKAAGRWIVLSDLTWVLTCIDYCVFHWYRQHGTQYKWRGWWNYRLVGHVTYSTRFLSSFSCLYKTASHFRTLKTKRLIGPDVKFGHPDLDRWHTVQKLTPNSLGVRNRHLPLMAVFLHVFVQWSVNTCRKHGSGIRAGRNTRLCIGVRHLGAICASTCVMVLTRRCF